MQKRIFNNKRTQRILIAALVVAVLAIAFSFPQVRAVANSFLGLFRVEQITVLPFDPTGLASNMENVQPSLDQMMTDSLKVEELSKYQEVSSAEEATALAGFPVRLPEWTGAGELRTFSVTPAMHIEFKVDLPRIRLIIEALGYEDVVLPDEIDGALVTADFPVGVQIRYGNCGPSAYDPDEPAASSNYGPSCTVFIQMPSPTISAPEGTDMVMLGKAFLQMTGMSAADAEAFSSTIDWSTTLVLPIPEDSDYQEVEVDGVTGAYVGQNNNYRPQYELIWVKDGIVYTLGGVGSRYHALSLANSLK